MSKSRVPGSTGCGRVDDGEDGEQDASVPLLNDRGL